MGFSPSQFPVGNGENEKGLPPLARVESTHGFGL
jgi:hypothetical protein